MMRKKETSEEKKGRQQRMSSGVRKERGRKRSVWLRHWCVWQSRKLHQLGRVRLRILLLGLGQSEAGRGYTGAHVLASSCHP